MRVVRVESSICWFTVEISAMAQAGPGRRQELGISAMFLMSARGLGPSFPRSLIRNLKGSATLRTETAHMRGRHCRW